MADKKKIGSTAALFDLKAELFRKKEHLKEAKAKSTADWIKPTKSDQHGKKDIWSKKNTGVQKRAHKDLAEKQEEDDIMERSRKALEAKSKIYDKIACSSGIPDDDGSDGYLVDFQKKAVDRIVEQRQEQSEEMPPPPPQPGEQWVDYVDTLGKTRTCMENDLPQMQSHIPLPATDPLGGGGELKLKEGATLLSADMKRELRRQQWEKEAEEAAKNGPIHYANVQFDEIRSHGTGFFQFSKNHNLRQEQLDLLNKMREQTMEGRQRSDQIKQKRKAALEARLAKIKQRRGLTSDTAENKDEEKSKTGEPVETIAIDESEKDKEPEPLTRDDSWRQLAPVREWDKGKQDPPVWNAERYFEERRSERDTDFAPPQFYFDQKPVSRPKHPQPNKTPASKSRDVNAVSSQLKQLRNSTRAVPATSTSSSQQDGAEREGTAVDLNSIPMPGDQPANVHIPAAVVSNPAALQMSVQPSTLLTDTCYRNAPQNTYLGSETMTNIPWFGPPPPLNTSVLSPLEHAPLLSQMAVPASMGQTSNVPPCLVSMQSAMPASGMPVQPWNTQSVAGPVSQQSSTCGFKYPSQQSVVTSQQQLGGERAAGNLTKPITKTAEVAPSRSSMVDKRFMQNREASESDLLGYMAQGADDALMGLQPVSYKPGSFTARQGNDRTERVSADVQSMQGIVGQQAVVSDGVVFGVPEFLQPAADMQAQTYQPGSFMAAKRAAALKAEEDYETARKKTQYASGPVLYTRSSDD